eukprot:1342505-Amorphochlora_amoeboformis.AAC.1
MAAEHGGELGLSGTEMPQTMDTSNIPGYSSGILTPDQAVAQNMQQEQPMDLNQVVDPNSTHSMLRGHMTAQGGMFQMPQHGRYRPTPAHHLQHQHHDISIAQSSNCVRPVVTSGLKYQGI